MGLGDEAVRLERRKLVADGGTGDVEGSMLEDGLRAHRSAGSDVFLHNLRAGKAERLGLGYDELSARNPRLVHVAINGLGTAGPEADQPVFDYVIQAKTGMIDYQRDASGQGDLMHQLVVDKTSANAAVQGVLAAL